MPKPSIVPLLPSQPLSPLPDYPESEIASGSRSSNGWFAMGNGGPGLNVGLWEAEPNESTWLDYPFHDFMLLLEGELGFVTDSETVMAKAGEALFVPKGLRCRYVQPTYVRKIVVAYDNPAEQASSSGLRVIKIDPDAKLAPSAPPSAEMLLSPVPVQHTKDYFEDATGQLSIGVWDTTGYRRKLIDFPRHEVMHLLEGSVTFTDDAGRSQTFQAGDTFFVPQGTPNAWTSEGYLRKIFVIFQPKA
jgi:uncharacterized cupin superfamily protein